MIELDNPYDIDVDLDLLNRVTKIYTDGVVELLIVDNSDIALLNKEHRGLDKPTDVLSFPLEPLPMFPLGSVVISYEKAKEVADKLGHSLDDEIKLLYIHGLLHLIGFDHETDSGQMRDEEQKLILEFDLPKSLIVRNSP